MDLSHGGGCTKRAASYLSSLERDIFVLNMGNSRLGFGTHKNDRGTAGVTAEYGGLIAEYGQQSENGA